MFHLCTHRRTLCFLLTQEGVMFHLCTHRRALCSISVHREGRYVPSLYTEEDVSHQVADSGMLPFGTIIDNLTLNSYIC